MLLLFRAWSFLNSIWFNSRRVFE